MPKKLPANPKAEEARARKEQQKGEKAAREAKAKEDAMWADEGSKSKAVKKRLDEEQKKKEAAERRAELERLKQEEEKEMAKLSKKGVKGPKNVLEGSPAKVTRAELDQIQEEERKKSEEAQKSRQKQALRVQDQADYEKMVSVANTNRMEAAVDARSLNEAVSQLSAVTVEEQAVLDKHPEKRLRAAFKVYEETELPRLRQETPGLTLTQYKEMIWKSWKKSPQNPLNQVTVR